MKELDIKLMELCKRELKSLSPEDWFRAEELKYYIKRYEKLLGM